MTDQNDSSSSNLFANLNQSDQPGAPEEVPAPETAVTEAETDETAPMTELEMLKNRARIMGIKFSNAIKVETLRAKITAKLNEDDGETSEAEDESEDEDLDDDAYLADEPVSLLSEDPIAVMSETRGQAPVPVSSGSSLLAQLALMSADEKAAMLALLGGTATAVANPAAPAPTRVGKVQAMREQVVAEQMALVRCRITNMDPKKKDLPGEIFTVANEYLGTVRKFVPYGEVTDDGYHLPVCIYTQLVERTFVSIRTVKNKNGRGTVTSTSDAREFSIEVLPPLTSDELARLANAQAAAAGN